MRRENLIFRRCGIIFLVFGCTLKVLATASDYAGTKATINFTAEIDELLVSKNRFVIGLDKAKAQLRFIDTWNWRVLNPAGSDTVSLFGVVSSMDSNPSGDRVYFSYPIGEIRWMDLAPLHNLGFNQKLNPTALHLEAGTTVPVGSGTTLKKIVAIQDSDSVSLDCIFAELKNAETSNLFWSLVKGNTVLGGGFLAESVGREMELAKSNNRLFVKFKDLLGNSWLYAYRCFSSSLGNVIVSDDLGANPLYQYQGLVSNQNGNVLILGNKDLAELWPYQIIQTIGNNLLALPGTPYNLLGGVPGDQIWLAKISAEPDSLVFFAQGAFLKLSTLAGNSAEFKTNAPIEIKNFSSSPLLLANSSATDGYIYVAPKGSETVSIITANPWISNLSTVPAGTIETESFQLKFSFNITRVYYTIAECKNFVLSPSQCQKTYQQGEVSGPGTAMITLSSQELGEGSHLLGVFLRDTSSPYHQGRNALPVKIDLAPVSQEFSLGFGDQRIFIKFKSPEVEDLKKYLIYYGTNCSADFHRPERIDDTGGNGNPTSPMVIKNPEPDHSYEKVVEQLENGKTYCVQIVTIDQSEKKSLSERKTITPEKTKSPSEEAGEEGGFSCAVSARATRLNSADSLILLFLPLTILILWNFRIKLRRGGGN